MKITRRGFFSRSAVAGASALLLGKQGFGRSTVKGSVPVIVTDHTNETGRNAVTEAFNILKDGGSALDAVEKGTNIIEVDPEDTSVGYGGLPNEEGIVQLDSSIMDGKTYNAGSVASIENIKNPSSVARLVMEKTDHVMLVGDGALKFAKKFGFKEVDLMTEKSRRIYLRWLERKSDRDDWGPPDHLRKRDGESAGVRGEGRGGSYASYRESIDHYHGTTNVLAVDKNGDISGITSTSGLAFKLDGRIGDSPIIGAGLYVDNEVGAAGATGRGEDVIKSCASFFIVMQMKAGRSPQQACEDANQLIIDKYKAIGSDYYPGEKFVAINKAGEYGCSGMKLGGKPKMAVMSSTGLKIHEGTLTK
ncbi:MAG: N(4)-(beta-N-acetylglucosaminyl)-L-asparaginase [Pyrinomonadaceae bacterium]|nr:N(4)-(beta-N-acetylglucosaminyl)-L-asparaginase [Pyrinomonadaceae bacterium]